MVNLRGVNCPMCFLYIFNLSLTNHALNIEFVSEISYSQVSCHMTLLIN